MKYIVMMCNLFYIRHAESTANTGEDDCCDAMLTKNGINQCKNLNGEFDIIFVSPLRRTLMTLENSQLKGKEVYVEPLIRERIFHERDMMMSEKHLPLKLETDEEFYGRVTAFQNKIKNYEMQNVSILVISHAYYLSGLGIWGMKNAELRKAN